MVISSIKEIIIGSNVLLPFVRKNDLKKEIKKIRDDGFLEPIDLISYSLDIIMPVIFIDSKYYNKLKF